MKRELYFRDLRSNKSWSVEIEGSELIVRWGKIGAKPREKRTTCASPEAARREADALATKKIAEGYIEGSVAALPPWQAADWSAQSMSEDVFWQLISLFDWKKSGDDDAVMRPAVKALASMAESEIFAFDDLLSEKLRALDTRAHCREAYRGEIDIDDGDQYVSADDFLYLRCVVVANGREFFDAALADPTKMPKQMEFEALLSIASDAFEKKCGREYEHVPAADFESFSNAAGWQTDAAARPGRFTDASVPPGNRRPT